MLTATWDSLDIQGYIQRTKRFHRINNLLCYRHDGLMERSMRTVSRRKKMKKMVKVETKQLNDLLCKEYLVEAVAKVIADDGSNDVKIAQIAAILQM